MVTSESKKFGLVLVRGSRRQRLCRRRAFTKLNERFMLKYSFEMFNVFNTPSFDVPIDDVTQNQYYNGFPFQLNSGPNAPTQALPTSCDNNNTGFYNCPFGLGKVNKTIGSARQIQMTLHLTF